jgi:hypothetical protein
MGIERPELSDDLPTADSLSGLLGRETMIDGRRVGIRCPEGSWCPVRCLCLILCYQHPIFHQGSHKPLWMTNAWMGRQSLHGGRKPSTAGCDDRAVSLSLVETSLLKMKDNKGRKESKKVSVAPWLQIETYSQSLRR